MLWNNVEIILKEENRTTRELEESVFSRTARDVGKASRELRMAAHITRQETIEYVT